MVNYKEILRLSHEGYSQRQIESSVHCSRHTVRDTLAAAERSGIAWPLEESATNEQIGAIKLEAVCTVVLKHTTVPSLRLISTILKNGLIKTEERKSKVKENRNAYGITRTAAAGRAVTANDPPVYDSTAERNEIQRDGI